MPSEELLGCENITAVEIMDVRIMFKDTLNQKIDFPIPFYMQSGDTSTIRALYDEVDETIKLSDQIMPTTRLNAEYAVFTEELVISELGKYYKQKLEVTIPKLRVAGTVADLKDSFSLYEGRDAFLNYYIIFTDANNIKWSVGEYAGMKLEDGFTSTTGGDDNFYKFVFSGISEYMAKSVIQSSGLFGKLKINEVDVVLINDSGDTLLIN